MSRVKRGSQRPAKRRKWLKQAKGFSGGRKNITRQAKQAVKKAGQRSYDHRKLKKRQFRALWNIRISAAAKANGTSYSKLIGALKKSNSELNRKVLSEIAVDQPAVFTAIVEKTK